MSLIISNPSKNSARLNALSRIFVGLKTTSKRYDDMLTLEDLEDNFRIRPYEQKDSYDFLLSLLSTLTQGNVFADVIRSLFEVRYKETYLCDYCKYQTTEERDTFVWEIFAVRP